MAAGLSIWMILTMQNAISATPAPQRKAILSSFMLGHFSHHLATAALVPLLPMIRESLALDYTQSGLLLSAFSLTYGLATLPMSAAADRLSGRLIVAIGLVATGAACIAFGVSGGFFQSILVLIFLGAAGATYHAPASAFLSQVFGKAGRGKSLGIHVIGGSAGLTVAPLVAVFVADQTGSWRNAFVVLGLPAIAAGILIWLSAGKQDAHNRQQKAAAGSVERMSFFAIVRLLGFLVVIAVMATLLVSGVNSFLPLYLVDKHGVSKEVAGLTVGVFYAANLVGAPLGGALSDRIGRKPVILLSVLSAGPLIFLLTVAPFGWEMITVIALYGVFVVFRLPAMESLIADLVPVQRRATVLGGYHFLAQETTGIATPIIGFTMDRIGFVGGFTALALLAVAASLLVLLSWRRI